MVFFNYALRKLNAKIVYYGPGLCGKTTNLQWIHDHFEGGQRGKMISLATEGDRTIFFDLLPIDIGSIRGMDVTLQLYTVPGQVHYNSTRQLVLRGADGVVFVADSQRTMRESNAESFENLQENLMLQGIDIKDFPHVLQFNKRDLRDLLNTEELNESLNVFSVPIFEGVATEGIGVQETLEGIVKLVMRNLREKYEPVANAGVPKAPAPMPVAVPATVTPAKAPSEKPDPLASDFLSDLDVPSTVEPAIPPATFEAPPLVEPPEMDETQAVGPDAGFAAFEDEDGISTKVYEDSEEEEIAQYKMGGDSSSSPVEEDTAADRIATEPLPDESQVMFTDPRDGDGTDGDGASSEFEPELPATDGANRESDWEPASSEDVSTDPEIVDGDIDNEAAEESMDDLFDAEPPSVQSYVKGVRSRLGDSGEASAVSAAGGPDVVAAPAATDRFEDRIEAPGPFAPAPSDAGDGPTAEAAELEATPEMTSDEAEFAHQEIQEQMRQAFGASENREALASLWTDEPEREPEKRDVLSGFLDDPPEVQPVVPPDDEPEPQPEVDKPNRVSNADEPVLGPMEVEEPEEIPEKEFHVGTSPKKSEVFDQIVVEAPVVEEPVSEELEIKQPVIEEPPPDEPVVSPSAFADDPITKAEPIMVGFGDPFAADDVLTPEVIPQDAQMMPSGNAIDVTAEGNQLRLQLKGSGAIAEMGQVRALDIEVPVPGQWIGNQKVTLQFRLTLTPAEDEDE